MDDFSHGTTGGYTNHKCRCADCKQAWARYQAKIREDSARAKRYEALYGLTPDGYLRLVSAQGDRCGICRVRREDFGKDFFVDHDHDTGVVRGLLCHTCNTGLGALGDTLEGVLNAVEYLRKASQNTPIQTNPDSIDVQFDPDRVEFTQETSFTIRIGPNA